MGASIFVSVYMILFSVLLFLYELMWWKSIDTVNKNLRLNFGFLYGVKGKALYLIFVAFLVIGLKDDVSVKFLRYLTGGSFLGTGVLMLFVHFTKPELLSSYQAPTAGFGDNINNPVLSFRRQLCVLLDWFFCTNKCLYFEVGKADCGAWLLYSSVRSIMEFLSAL